MIGWVIIGCIMGGCLVTGLILRKMKFKRDIKNKKIAGVCAGLAKCCKRQPRWFRLGFIISVIIIGWPLFLYIALWIVLEVEKDSTTEETSAPD